ncbi:flagellar biosynthetic protein FliO [Sphingomonas sp. ac-8]|uniref:flagellar biosynthetic protein FliO n=1 Tax=Sphingomonas sp. ac-8 TaxID=3242977 RepID=UPI003A80483D
MDVLSLLRTLGGLGIVLGLLWGALWLVRRYDIKLPGRIGGAAERRLELVERVAVDAKRSVVLIRRDDREHLLFIDPAGTVVVEAGIARSASAAAAPAAESAEMHDTSATAPLATFREALDRIQARKRRVRGEGEHPVHD